MTVTLADLIKSTGSGEGITIIEYLEALQKKDLQKEAVETESSDSQDEGDYGFRKRKTPKPHFSGDEMHCFNKWKRKHRGKKKIMTNNATEISIPDLTSSPFNSSSYKSNKYLQVTSSNLTDLGSFHSYQNQNKLNWFSKKSKDIDSEILSKNPTQTSVLGSKTSISFCSNENLVTNNKQTFKSKIQNNENKEDKIKQISVKSIKDIKLRIKESKKHLSGENMDLACRIKLSKNSFAMKEIESKQCLRVNTPEVNNSNMQVSEIFPSGNVETTETKMPGLCKTSSDIHTKGNTEHRRDSNIAEPSENSNCISNSEKNDTDKGGLCKTTHCKLNEDVSTKRSKISLLRNKKINIINEDSLDKKFHESEDSTNEHQRNDQTKDIKGESFCLSSNMDKSIRCDYSTTTSVNSNTSNKQEQQKHVGNILNKTSTNNLKNNNIPSSNPTVKEFVFLFSSKNVIQPRQNGKLCYAAIGSLVNLEPEDEESNGCIDEKINNTETMQTSKETATTHKEKEVRFNQDSDKKLLKLLLAFRKELEVENFQGEEFLQTVNQWKSIKEEEIISNISDTHILGEEIPQNINNLQTNHSNVTVSTNISPDSAPVDIKEQCSNMIEEHYLDKGSEKNIYSNHGILENKKKLDRDKKQYHHTITKCGPQVSENCKHIFAIEKEMDKIKDKANVFSKADAHSENCSEKNERPISLKSRTSGYESLLSDNLNESLNATLDISPPLISDVLSYRNCKDRPKSCSEPKIHNLASNKSVSNTSTRKKVQKPFNVKKCQKAQPEIQRKTIVKKIQKTPMSGNCLGNSMCKPKKISTIQTNQQNKKYKRQNMKNPTCKCNSFSKTLIPLDCKPKMYQIKNEQSTKQTIQLKTEYKEKTTAEKSKKIICKGNQCQVPQADPHNKLTKKAQTISISKDTSGSVHDDKKENTNFKRLKHSYRTKKETFHDSLLDRESPDLTSVCGILCSKDKVFVGRDGLLYSSYQEAAKTSRKDCILRDMIKYKEGYDVALNDACRNSRHLHHQKEFPNSKPEFDKFLLPGFCSNPFINLIKLNKKQIGSIPKKEKAYINLKKQFST